MAGTGLVNEALDDLALALAGITGVPIVRDPRNITPGCVLIGAPTVTPFNTNNIVTLDIPLTAIGTGPGNQDALDSLLTIVSLILGKNIGVTGPCRPSTISIGGVDAPAYDMTVRMQAHAA